MPTSISGHSIDAAVRNPNDMRRLLQGIAHRMAIYDDQLGIFDGFLDDPSDIHKQACATGGRLSGKRNRRKIRNPDHLAPGHTAANGHALPGIVRR